jgi:hypothetical protein
LILRRGWAELRCKIDWVARPRLGCETKRTTLILGSNNA